MDNLEPEQFKKLPKWAADHIRRLETRLQEAADDIAKRDDQKPTRVLVEPHAERPYYLPNDSTVQFSTGGDGWVQVRLAWESNRVRESPDLVEIMGIDSISVSPRSSNVIRVRVNR